MIKVNLKLNLGDSSKKKRDYGHTKFEVEEIKSFVDDVLTNNNSGAVIVLRNNHNQDGEEGLAAHGGVRDMNNNEVAAYALAVLGEIDIAKVLKYYAQLIERGGARDLKK